MTQDEKLKQFFLLMIGKKEKNGGVIWNREIYKH